MHKPWYHQQIIIGVTHPLLAELNARHIGVLESSGYGVGRDSSGYRHRRRRLRASDRRAACSAHTHRCLHGIFLFVVRQRNRQRFRFEIRQTERHECDIFGSVYVPEKSVNIFFRSFVMVSWIFHFSAFGTGVNLAGSEAHGGFVCSASMKHRQARGQEENQKKKKRQVEATT